MVNSVTSIVKKLSYWLWVFAVAVIVLLAVGILVGRQAIGDLDRLRPTAQSFIASNTGMEVNLGELSGDWSGLMPTIDVASFEITDSDKTPALSVHQGRANLDLFNTIRYGIPIWKELIIQDLVISFSEDAEGHWRLKGFSGESDSDLDIIIKPFLASRLIRLKSTTINLQFFSGTSSSVYGTEMLIENDDDFHRAQMSLSFARDDIPAQLIIEAVGDASDLDSIYGDGYFKFEELNISEPLQGFTQSLMPELFKNLPQSEVKTGGELWVDIKPGGAIDFAGQLTVSSLPLSWLADVPPITDIATEISGWYTPGLNWGMRLKDFILEWSGQRIEPHDMMFTQHLGSNWQEFDLSMSYLNLTLLNKLLLETQISAPQIISIMDETRLRGSLSSLTFAKGSAGFHISAGLHELHMLPYKGAPGIKDLSGYFEVNEAGGLFHISDSDGFDLLFPKQYRDYLSFKSAEGTIYVDWQANKEMLLVRSDVVTTQSAAGEAKILFSVEQAMPSRGRAPEFNLIIGARDLDASYGGTLLPYRMPESLSKWLKSSIKTGNIKEFAMLSRSGPPKNNKASRTTQLLFNTQQTNIEYHPDWPALNDMKAVVTVDDGFVSSDINSAKLGQAIVTEAAVEYVASFPVEERRLIVDASLSAGVAETIDLMANSPLRKNIGPLAQWHYKGQSQTQMHLEIPLVRDSAGRPIVGEYRINSVIDQALISITDSPVELEGVSGSIKYTTEGGLYSDNLVATLWQQPFKATIFRDKKQQKMALKTTISPSSLNKFVDFPWTEVITGSIPIEGILNINGSDKPTTLQLGSSMQGIALNLPDPLGKPTEESRPLDMTLHFDPSFSRLEASLGDKLSADLQFLNNQLDRALVSYDRSSLSPQKGQVLVAAYLPTTDFEIWTPLQALFQGSQQLKTGSLDTVFDLKFDYLRLANLDMRAIAAKVTALEAGLNVQFTSDLADGQITLPWEQQQAPIIDLVKLQLSEKVLEQSSRYSAIDPRQFTELDFSVEQLLVGDQSLGSLAFKLRPEPSGAAFSNFSGDLLGMRLGIFESEAPAEYFWGYDGVTHFSKIVGPVGIANINDLLSGFGIPRVLDSQSGKLDLDLSWVGKPWAIGKENINGDFRVSLNEGSFYRSTGGAEATLKVISLFNFANWTRRLQLDFSDVVGKNLSYNSLEGLLSFNDGTINLKEPLKIQMPSGKMSMAGEFNLLDETVDAQLVATLPVGVNLPWLVGIVGGLPAAAGVYITSKLVEKQVDKLSSISYTLNGPWNDIEVSVKEIFADQLP